MWKPNALQQHGKTQPLTVPWEKVAKEAANKPVPAMAGTKVFTCTAYNQEKLWLKQIILRINTYVPTAWSRTVNALTTSISARGNSMMMQTTRC